MCSHACLHNTIYIFFAQISKAAIKNYQIGRRIPHCGFELELVCHKSPQVQRLRHKVVIKGIASPNRLPHTLSST